MSNDLLAIENSARLSRLEGACQLVLRKLKDLQITEEENQDKIDSVLNAAEYFRDEKARIDKYLLDLRNQNAYLVSKIIRQEEEIEGWNLYFEEASQQLLQVQRTQIAIAKNLNRSALENEHLYLNRLFVGYPKRKLNTPQKR